MKIYAIKRLRKITNPPRNAGFKSSKSTQKKRKLQAKFEELDIARRNAAMNSSRETLLREEEEEKKRLRYPIGLESLCEASPPGQPTCVQHDTPDRKMKNPYVEILSDDDASDLILLKDLKQQIFTDPDKRHDNSTQQQGDIKQETTRKDETDLEKDKEIDHSLIDRDSGDIIQERPTTPPLILLVSYEEVDISYPETTTTRQSPEVQSQQTLTNSELPAKRHNHY